MYRPRVCVAKAPPPRRRNIRAAPLPRGERCFGIPLRAHLPAIVAQARRPACAAPWRPSCGPGEASSMCVPRTLVSPMGGLLPSAWHLARSCSALRCPWVWQSRNPAYPQVCSLSVSRVCVAHTSRVCVLPCIYRGEEWSSPTGFALRLRDLRWTVSYSGCTGTGETLHRVLRPSSGQARMHQRASAVELNPEESMSTAWPRVRFCVPDSTWLVWS